MNPIPVRVWSAAHDHTLIPSTIAQADSIAYTLFDERGEQPNPLYQAFAHEMLEWMKAQKISKIGQLGHLWDDLDDATRCRDLELYFEQFPRDHGTVFKQFVQLARRHGLIVYDTAGPNLFLPDGTCVPEGSDFYLNQLDRLYRTEQQKRKPTDLPSALDEVPDWLCHQMNSHFAAYGFSECVIQDDGVLWGYAWKKTPVGLLLIEILVKERWGQLTIGGDFKVFCRDLFRLKQEIGPKDYYNLGTNPSIEDVSVRFEDFSKLDYDLWKKGLTDFFPAVQAVWDGYIHACTDFRDLYDYVYAHGREDARRLDSSTSYFLRYATLLLDPTRLDDLKELYLDMYALQNPLKNPEKQTAQRFEMADAFNRFWRNYLQDRGFPTLAADPDFHTFDPTVEDRILQAYQLV
jgi:hypothetical protein